MEIVKHNFVFYCDGSCNPNPNGIHSLGYFGYYYPSNQLEEVDGKKGSKIKGLKVNLRVTNLGVVTPKLEQENPRLYKEAIDVSPSHYVLGCKNLGLQGTNYKAELQAIIYTLGHVKKVIEESKVLLGDILIKSDSIACVNLINRLVSGENLDLSKYKSPELLESINSLIKVLKQDNKIVAEHVYGHSSSLGNIIVDRLAYLSWLGKEDWKEEVYIVDEKDNFFNPIELPEYLNFKNIYFVNGHQDTSTPSPYIVMDYGKTETVGDKTGDVCMGTVFVDNKDELVESMIKTHLQDGEDGVIFSLDINNLKDVITKILFTFDKEKVLTKNNRPKHLTILEELPIINTIRPSGLAKHLLSKFSFSFDLLDLYNSKKETNLIKQIDITDLFFKKKEKSRKDIYEIVISHKDNELLVEANGLKIPITLGVDVPNRNYLKKFERASEIEIILYLISVSDKVFTYTILTKFKTEENEVIGIWENYFSNRIYK